MEDLEIYQKKRIEELKKRFGYFNCLSKQQQELQDEIYNCAQRHIKMKKAKKLQELKLKKEKERSILRNDANTSERSILRINANNSSMKVETYPPSQRDLFEQ